MDMDNGAVLRFILHKSHFDTLAPFVARFAGAVGKRIELVGYDELFRARRIPGCVHVFTDIERLGDADAERAAHVWESIRRAAPELQLLNHPLRCMRRYELLRTLREADLNSFDVYRLTEARKPARFPVFLRGENDHAGPETGLLRTDAELDAAIQALEPAGKSRGSRLVTEYCAESDGEGIFRKYGAFYIGGEVVPRHVMWSRDWNVKQETRILGDAQWAEERRYLDANPHAEWIRRVFALARIDYGRIDYAIVGERPQVYEINTNPTIIPAEVVKLRPSGEWFVAAFAESLTRLESGTNGASAERASVRIDRPLKRCPGAVLSAVLEKTLGQQFRRSM